MFLLFHFRERKMRKIDPLDLYEFLTKIPVGKVVTYGTIAKYLGNKSFARTVGNILHQNPDGKKYPCYKVVTAGGRLAEHYAFGGLEKQKELLERDGIAVNEYKVDLSKYEWQL